MGVTATHELVRKDGSAVDPSISNPSLPKSILVLFGTSERRAMKGPSANLHARKANEGVRLV